LRHNFKAKSTFHAILEGFCQVSRGKTRGFDIIPLDIPDPTAVKKAVNNPDISLVISVSAYPAVDKAEGEAKVRHHFKKHIIIRTAWFYGINSNNFAKTIRL
jgi:dTDP-4-dehydrorhamnose reductase